MTLSTAGETKSCPKSPRTRTTDRELPNGLKKASEAQRTERPAPTREGRELQTPSEVEPRPRLHPLLRDNNAQKDDGKALKTAFASLSNVMVFSSRSRFPHRQNGEFQERHPRFVNGQRRYAG